MKSDMTAPKPLVPPEVDLRDFPFMPVDVRRLLTSETWLTATGEEKAAAMTLWLESWHQAPAGSLPDNDRMLAVLSQAGSRWPRVKAAALRGWTKCSDGRLYHPVVCEKALSAWEQKRTHKAKREKDATRLKRWRERQRNTDETHTETENETRFVAATSQREREREKKSPSQGKNVEGYQRGDGPRGCDGGYDDTTGEVWPIVLEGGR